MFYDFELSYSQISRTILYGIITDRLAFHKFCARWIQYQLTDFYKTQKMTTGLNLFAFYNK